MLSVIAKVLTTWVQQIEGHFFCPQNWRKIKKALTQKGKTPLGKNENHEGDNKVPLPYKPIDQFYSAWWAWSVHPNWHEGGHFPLPCTFWIWIFIKNLQTFLEVKIDIKRMKLTPFQAHWVLWNPRRRYKWALFLFSKLMPIRVKNC